MRLPAKRAVAVAGLLVASPLLLTVSQVSAATSPPVYHGCANKKTHAVRLLVKHQKCTSRELKLVWDRRGPSGLRGLRGLPGARGATGVTGATGATGAQGAQGTGGPQGQQGAPGLPANLPTMYYTTTSMISGTLTDTYQRVAGLTGLPAGQYLVQAHVTVVVGDGQQADHNVVCGIGVPNSGSPDTVTSTATGYVRPQFPSTGPSTQTHSSDLMVVGQAPQPEFYLDCKDPQYAPGATPAATVSVQYLTLVGMVVKSVTPV